MSIPPSPVVMTLRGWNEKQAMSPCGLPIFSHCPFHRISLPIAQAASSITGRPRRLPDLDDARQIARHPELVDAEDRLRALGDRRLDQRRVHVEAVSSMSMKTGVAPQ